MRTATNVDATAVNTVAWLSAAETTIVVPVYQRQYRWDIGACEQLLADVLAVADSDERDMHFIGSILSSTSSGDEGDELVLIDGQQRVTTLMLLVAALQHAVRDVDPGLAAELGRVLVHPGSERTKLRPHPGWAGVFEDVVLDRRGAAGDADAGRDSRFDDNYAFFRSRIGGDEAQRIWAGLQKLEHVAITLGAGANAQQIFESLNSTGEPLRDHELIHNYVLMGLTHDEQREIEREYWVPIEQATGEAIATFWRHHLVSITGREIDTAGGRGVYDAFRQRFPRLEIASLREHAAGWRADAEAYRVLLDPSLESDALIARKLREVAVFGRAMHPLVLRVFRDHASGRASREELLAALDDVQSLLLRRTVVGLGVERLVARLCRAREEGADALRAALVRIVPSDERVRVAVKYGELPHARYVLGRLADLDPLDDLDVEHVAPLAPGDDWTGDGARTFAELGDDEQNSLRALAPTLGNLALLEPELADDAEGRAFPRKRERIYPRSAVPLTRELADADAWGTAAIGARTARLTEELLGVWRRPGAGLIDDDGLTPVLDAQRRRGWPAGWQREFDYVEYRGEHWEVKDVRHLFNRVFKRLWADSRPHVVAFSERRGGPVFSEQAWNGQWDVLDERAFIYMGWDSRYMLTAVQGLLDDAGIAGEVFVKYSYIGDAMG